MTGKKQSIRYTHTHVCKHNSIGRLKTYLVSDWLMFSTTCSQSKVCHCCFQCDVSAPTPARARCGCEELTHTHTRFPTPSHLAPFGPNPLYPLSHLYSRLQKNSTRGISTRWGPLILTSSTRQSREESACLYTEHLNTVSSVQMLSEKTKLQQVDGKSQVVSCIMCVTAGYIHCHGNVQKLHSSVCSFLSTGAKQ